MIRRTNLPDELVLHTGEVLKPVIGGHLANKPFLTVAGAGVDVTKNGWGDTTLAQYSTPRRQNWEEHQIIAEAKRQGRKYRKVSVLSRNLRGKNDLHGRPYTGTRWVFVEVKP